MTNLEADADKSGVDPLALLAHHVRLNALLNRMLVEHESRALASAREISALKATAERQAAEHVAALTDRDLAHSQQVELLQSDIDRLHQAIRDQGKQSLESEALAHGHARAARQELDDHVQGRAQRAPTLIDKPKFNAIEDGQ